MLSKMGSMKAIIFAIIVMLFDSLAYAGEFSNNMLERQQIELAAINSTEAPSFTKEEIDKIEFNVRFNRQDRGFRHLIYVTWKKLLSENKVRRLTLALREKLDIPRVQCAIANRCSELVAVYLPQSNFLLVDFEAVNTDNAPWFFHELVHAVQYTYRFPLDIEILYEYSQKGSPDGVKIKQEQLVDYLRFFYEAQANWYTLRLEQDRDWMNQRQSGYISGTIAATKIVLGLFTMTISFHLFKELFEGLLPEIDQQPDSRQLKMRGIDLFEMIMIKKFYAINPGIHFDFGFLEKYTRAIERAYFGELDFLYQDNNGDQKIYRDLHNKFYGVFGDRTPGLLERCGKTFEALQNGSPYLNWLTLPAEQLSCGPYTNSSFLLNREAIAEIFLTSEKSGSYQGGTKGGGGPALKISPYIQPQLIVLPE